LKISNLYIDSAVRDFSETRVICQRLNIPFQVVDTPEAVYDALDRAVNPVEEGKKTLFLTRNRGKFIRQCPGTEYYTCCNYMILHIGTFCNMDCSYCILQAYFHPPLLQLFVNHDDMLASLSQLFGQQKVTRIGTGEFTDSLIWEDIYPLAEKLIAAFSEQSCCVLELKTKTVNIDHLMALRHNRKTIMAWSLNTERVIRTEEVRTSSLHQRLAAAAKCQKSGYPLAFHFDPLVIYPGCEDEYEQTIRRLFEIISPDSIVWISLGTFRFIPSLKSIIEQRFTHSKIVYGEFIRGMDGKMRYFKPMRIRFYRRIISYIREYAPEVTIYFCMEDDEVWFKSLGVTPAEKGWLPTMLDASAIRHCDLS
jgi:spore photoproduct lyase